MAPHYRRPSRPVRLYTRVTTDTVEVDVDEIAKLLGVPRALPPGEGSALPSDDAVGESAVGIPTPGSDGRRDRSPIPVPTLAPGSDGSLAPRDQPITDGERYAPIELSPDVKQHLKPVAYDGQSPMRGRVHVIEGWEDWPMDRKIAFIRSFVEDTSRDPAIARKANAIARAANVPQRDHRGTWAALLKWVQRNIRFTAEPNERIQSPQYTLTERHGDCDDLGVALAGLAHSIRLPFKFVLSGRDAKGNRVRWVEGEGKCPQANWSHIYLQAQWPPFRPNRHAWAEPTLDVPLGFDPLKYKGKSRADLSGTALSRWGTGDDDVEAAAAAAEGASIFETYAILKAVKKVPWYTVGASAAGSLLAAALWWAARKDLDRRGPRRGRA